ncbi:ribose-5-phosphate isomerase RpiA [uncultured Sphingomonas sp.]|uniref:ribose-5-phosphate isomerase RpiA n=1 Tax=uncultured Sphingomonas sp. TaxID=158754 RepID=UPI0025CB9B82|nr:ribose-5-phosphate isomerase RpiA [uncultured Sphingomonas sp.]
MSDLEAEKALAAKRAVDEIQDGMLVGLGTGSTANYVLKYLGKRVAAGLRITAVPTSRMTEALARELAVPLVAFGGLSSVDLTIDGADEIDQNLQAIKGGGGALLREKVIAAASARVIAVVDSSKVVRRLGRFPLPVEVFPFAAEFVGARLADLGVPVSLRLQNDDPLLTDHGNHILDVAFGVITDPQQTALAIAAIPGVAAHSLFLSEIDTIIVGRDGAVDVRHADRS